MYWALFSLISGSFGWLFLGINSMHLICADFFWHPGFRLVCDLTKAFSKNYSEQIKWGVSPYNVDMGWGVV